MTDTSNTSTRNTSPETGARRRKIVPTEQRAKFMPRLVALIIDALVGFALALPGNILFLVGASAGEGDSGILTTLGVLTFVVSLFVSFYIFTIGMARNGQTPGKRVMGIKVTKHSGEPLGLLGAIFRAILFCLTNTLFFGLPIGSLWMLIDANNKTMYDMILNNKATVVRQRPLMPFFAG